MPRPRRTVVESSAALVHGVGGGPRHRALQPDRAHHRRHGTGDVRDERLRPPAHEPRRAPKHARTAASAGGTLDQPGGAQRAGEWAASAIAAANTGNARSIMASVAVSERRMYPGIS